MTSSISVFYVHSSLRCTESLPLVYLQKKMKKWTIHLQVAAAEMDQWPDNVSRLCKERNATIEYIPQVGTQVSTGLTGLPVSRFLPFSEPLWVPQVSFSD